VGKICNRLDQRAEQIDLVIVVGALQHRRGAFEPHAGVDRRPRQVDPLAAFGELLILHEYEIPYLGEPIAVGFRAAGRPTPNLVAVVVEDFRTRAAWSGIAHRPEIVGAGDPQDSAVRQSGNLLPEFEGLVVVDIDGRGQLLRRNAELFGHQIPGKLDGAFLEVIAEREVAEHLEKRVVPCGVSDVVEIVVLAAGAHALLRRYRARIRPLLQAGEDILELHHAGIGEHQCRIVARHQRRRRHDLVPFAGEVVQEGRPDFVDAAH
jgi:hypothetical protein